MSSANIFTQHSRHWPLFDTLTLNICIMSAYFSISFQSISFVIKLSLIHMLTLVLLNPDMPAFANSVDPEANWSGSALFAIMYVNLYQ